MCFSGALTLPILQVLSSGSFILQWMGPCYAASEIVSEEFLFSKRIFAQPLIFDVNSQRAAAVRSSWQNDSRLWTAGMPMTFSLSVRDKFGNAIKTYNDELELVDVSRVFFHVRTCC
jgi:hypothetical protein